MFNRDIPAQERLPLTETVSKKGLSVIRTTGRVLLSAVEGAIEGAIDSVSNEIELYKQDQFDRAADFAEIEEHANNLEAHKKL